MLLLKCLVVKIFCGVDLGSILVDCSVKALVWAQ